MKESENNFNKRSSIREPTDVAITPPKSSSLDDSDEEGLGKLLKSANFEYDSNVNFIQVNPPQPSIVEPIDASITPPQSSLLDDPDGEGMENVENSNDSESFSCALL